MREHSCVVPRSGLSQLRRAALVAMASVTICATGPIASAAITATFQEGLDGYAGTADTYLQNNDLSSHGSIDTVYVLDQVNPTRTIQQGLLRFDNILGPGTIPLGSTIISAALTVYVADGTDHTGTDPDVYVHRMLQPWTEDDTWSDWGDGIDPDGTEAAASPDLTIPGPIPSFALLTIDVTTSVQAWSDGASNWGWVFYIEPLTNEQWGPRSSEYASGSLRPLLEVTFVPEPGTLCLLAVCALGMMGWRRSEIRR